MSLEQFYSVRLGTAKRAVKSKRINEAISKMKTQRSLQDEDISKKKRKTKEKFIDSQKSSDFDGNKEVDNALDPNQEKSPMSGQTSATKSETNKNDEVVHSSFSRTTRKRTKRNAEEKAATQNSTAQKEIVENGSSISSLRAKKNSKTAKSKPKSKNNSNSSGNNNNTQRKRKVNLSESSSGAE